MPDALAAILAAVTLAATIGALRAPAKGPSLVALAALSTAGVLALALADAGAPLLVLALAVSCVAFGLAAAVTRALSGAMPGEMVVAHLQRHLARCRRHGDTATVLVARLPSDARRRNVTDALRITDSATVRRAGRSWELQAILDDGDVPRELVTQRVGEALGEPRPMIGWATFPDDGLTLEALLEHARSGAIRETRAP